MDQLEQYAYRVRIAMMKTQRKINACMQSYDDWELTRPQLYVLNMLAQEGPCKISQLAKKLEVAASTISSMIDRLVQMEMVLRQYGDVDRRNVFVSITAYGQELLEREMHIYKSVLSQFLSPLRIEELEMFVLLFEKIANTDLAPDS